MASSEPPKDCLTVVYQYARIVGVFISLFMAYLALWGDKARERWAGPKLILCPKNLDGDQLNPEQIKGSKHGPTWRYYLDVVNRRTWVLAKEVQVRCTKAFIKQLDDTYTEQPFEYPVAFKWTTKEGKEDWNASFKGSYLCDLGTLRKESASFVLSVRTDVHGFPSTVTRDQSIRYNFEIDASNFLSKRPLCLQIDWDGEWSSDRTELAKHLLVKIIR